MKKFKGAGGSVLFESIFCIAAILLVTAFAVNALLPFVIKVKAQNIAKKYTIGVREDGYLTPQKKIELLSELTMANCENIVLDATTIKVKYGEDVKLNIKYDTKMKVLKSSDSFLPTLEDEITTVEIPNETVSGST